MSRAKGIGSRIKSMSIILIVGVLAVHLLGCEMGNKTITRDEVTQCIDDIKKKNATAIEKRDGELAREVWSEVTEYSVLAKEHDDVELSEGLSTVASTYVHLVNYCNTGQKKDLQKFEQQFDESYNNLAKLVEKKN